MLSWNGAGSFCNVALHGGPLSDPTMPLSDEERPMNHFFDDDSEYGEMLNRDAWLRGETDSDLEREADEMEQYAEAMGTFCSLFCGPRCSPTNLYRRV